MTKTPENFEFLPWKYEEKDDEFAAASDGKVKLCSEMYLCSHSNVFLEK